MTVKAERNTAARFIRRYGQKAMCDHCGRDLGMTYLLNIDGDDVVMGRRCAARTLGWATTRVEMEAIRVERMAELNRRRDIIGAAYPALADANDRCNREDFADLDWDARNALHVLRAVFLEASNGDHFWDETRPNYGRFGTWQEYVASHVTEG